MTLNTCTVLLNEIRNMEWNEVEWNGLAGTVPFHYFWKTLSQESLFHPPPPPSSLEGANLSCDKEYCKRFWEPAVASGM